MLIVFVFSSISGKHFAREELTSRSNGDKLCCHSIFMRCHRSDTCILWGAPIHFHQKVPDEDSSDHVYIEFNGG